MRGPSRRYECVEYATSRADVDYHERACDTRMRDGQGERHPTAHGVAEHDRLAQLLVGDERRGVLHHRVDRIVELGAPFRIAMATLIQREDVEAFREVKAHQVPRV